MERNKLGMILFLISEGVFFTLLILAFWYYHSAGKMGNTAAQVLNVKKTAFFSLALFASSGTFRLAERRKHTAFWLALTLLLGTVFLAGQAHEYAGLLRQNITISSGLFGTAFFTLTGFHGLHVFVGLILLSILCVLGKSASRAMTPVGLYWHFVDAVWVVIFSLVYIYAVEF